MLQPHFKSYSILFKSFGTLHNHDVINPVFLKIQFIVWIQYYFYNPWCPLKLIIRGTLSTIPDEVYLLVIFILKTNLQNFATALWAVLRAPVISPIFLSCFISSSIKVESNWVIIYRWGVVAIIVICFYLACNTKILDKPQVFCFEHRPQKLFLQNSRDWKYYCTHEY